VTLHIYDVSNKSTVKQVNALLNAVGTGAFHGGVEVYGKEWSYGYTKHGTGVFCNAPRGCKMHRYRESVEMGQTSLSRHTVENLIGGLEWTWQGVQYSVLERNCVTFCDELCRLLGVNPVPDRVKHLSSTGATLQRHISRTLTNTQLAQENAAITVQRIWRGHAQRRSLWHKVGPLVAKYKQRAQAAKAKALQVAKDAAHKAHEKAKDVKHRAATSVQRIWRGRQARQNLAKTAPAAPSGGSRPYSSEQHHPGHHEADRSARAAWQPHLNQSEQSTTPPKAQTASFQEEAARYPQVVAKAPQGRPLSNCYLYCDQDCAIM